MPGGAPGQRLRAIEGTVPPLGELPPGCAFQPRCPDRFEPCTTAPPRATTPPDRPDADDRQRPCYLHGAADAHARPALLMPLVEVSRISSSTSRATHGLFRAGTRVTARSTM